ncbi:MAG: DUF1932 domain-containing protein [Immundisolibacteraceae bacterium]|nr:DUF1932 domain-containing protein [Immundisolibacteraceae bacterium]
MKPARIGLLHPGSMGVSIAATLQASGAEVYWASQGRSSATRQRAEQHQLIDVDDPINLLTGCDLLISICPPHAALAMANWATDNGFTGIYVDANAISPASSLAIGKVITGGGGDYVDGGVIGGPAWQSGTTWLHLSGSRAAEVAALFAAGPLQASVLSDQVGDASALKMVFAAQTKGSIALISATLAAAQSLGVREALQQQWQDLGMGLAQQAELTLMAAMPKAWRFVGEMEEVAATFEAAGLPQEFHQAAATVFRRMAERDNAGESREVTELLERLVRHSD